MICLMEMEGILETDWYAIAHLHLLDANQHECRSKT